MLAKQLIEACEVKDVFAKADREWHESTGEVKKDNILINEDKTPNMADIKNIFPNAKTMSEMIISDYKYAFVWGPNANRGKVAGLQIISISPMKDQIFEKARWQIAGRFNTEKHGSYTTCDGIVQTFRRAVKGDDNVDELQFFVDVLKGVGVEPIGRTVDEVRRKTT
jgi:NADH dehydrogenase/NADH:ubiquinone oxidoreductase subunit G